MTLEEHKTTPNQDKFFHRLNDIKTRIKTLSYYFGEYKREEIEEELTSISEEFEQIFKVAE